MPHAKPRQDYLKLVVETIARHGNRGVSEFIEAFSEAQDALTRFEHVDEITAEKFMRDEGTVGVVCDCLERGLKAHKASRFFDAAVDKAYADLRRAGEAVVATDIAEEHAEQESVYTAEVPKLIQAVVLGISQNLPGTKPGEKDPQRDDWIRQTTRAWMTLARSRKQNDLARLYSEIETAIAQR